MNRPVHGRGRTAGGPGSPGPAWPEPSAGTPEQTHSPPPRPPAGDKPETVKPHRVVSAAGHISYDHVGDRQNLSVFRLLDEDGHSPGDQLTVILYPLCPGDELPVGVVSCGDQSQQSAAVESTCPCPDPAPRGLERHFCPNTMPSHLGHTPIQEIDFGG